MRKRIVQSLMLILPIYPGTAAAQSDYGGGWAIPSLDTAQSIIREQHDRAVMDRAILGERREDTPPEPMNKVQRPPSVLAFTPNPDVRQRNVARMVRAARTHSPTNAEMLSALFASSDMFAYFARGIAPQGLQINNIADAYTVYWIAAWEASRGIIGSKTSREQAQAVKAQVTRALLNDSAIAEAPPARKQELAEELLVQAALISAFADAAAGQPEQLRTLAQAVRQGASAIGLDLDAMELGEAGFVLRKM
jgi:hypothetical protein